MLVLTVSSPASLRSWYATISSSVSPGSMTLVTPASLNALNAALMASMVSGIPASGMCVLTRFMAGPSSSMPVGSPSSLRTILPPRGSGVSLVTPPISRAALLATRRWPQVRVSTTGLSGDASSRSHLDGYLCSASLAWSQPLPSIHSPGLDSAAFSATASFMSSMLVMGGVLQFIICRAVPVPTTWMWLS